MSESQWPLLYDVADRIATLVINRPEQRNAIDAPTARAIQAAVGRFESDGEAWVGIITGAGDRAFCAGMDLKAFAAGQGPELVDARGGFAGLISYPRTKPLIAAVNGAAVGGGCEIVLACDLVVAAEHAVLGLPEVKRGIFAGAGGCFRLPRTIPRMRAMEMLLTGDPIDARSAFELGLVNRVVPGEGLMDAETLALARAAFDLSEEELWARNNQAWERINRTEDAREGPLAFAEKRPPRWTAR